MYHHVGNPRNSTSSHMDRTMYDRLRTSVVFSGGGILCAVTGAVAAAVVSDAPEAMMNDRRGLGGFEVDADRDGVFGGGEFEFQGLPP